MKQLTREDWIVLRMVGIIVLLGIAAGLLVGWGIFA